MSNASVKTVPTAVSIEEFIDRLEKPQLQDDARTLVALLSRITGEPAVMWGPAIIGFGTFHYRYESGREGDMPLMAFSPRAAGPVLYLEEEFAEGQAEALVKLGPHKTGKVCLYLKRLSDVDMNVLEEILIHSYKRAAARS